MAKMDPLKHSGKRSKVREKSVKSQGILKTILSGNPVIITTLPIRRRSDSTKQRLRS